MKAYVNHKYGGPEVLNIEEVEKPTPKADELLVELKATSANPADWHRLRASPSFIRLMTGLFKPKEKILGADFSGVVVAMGEGVSGFEIGDKVFGDASTGSYAAFNAIKASLCAIKPDNVTHEEAAAMGIAGVTALQAIRDHGKVKAGEKVLINGASGGVGHYCVQIAKAFGAEVTAVCSSKNIEMVKSIGADYVIDYTKENIHILNQKYDLVLDVHGNMKYADYKRLCNEQKRGVLIGFVGMGHMIAVNLRRMFGNMNIAQFTAKAKAEDSAYLGRLASEGKLKTVFDSHYTFEEIPKAIGYIEDMHCAGKVGISFT